MAKRGEIVREVTSREDLDAWIEKSERVLVVMDLFKEWCGRCVVLDPMYKRLTVELDDWDKRVAFLAVDRKLLTPEELAAYGVPSGCKPYVVVLKHKMAIGRVDGANAAEINSIVVDNVPAKPEA